MARIATKAPHRYTRSPHYIRYSFGGGALEISFRLDSVKCFGLLDDGFELIQKGFPCTKYLSTLAVQMYSPPFLFWIDLSPLGYEVLHQTVWSGNLFRFGNGLAVCQFCSPSRDELRLFSYLLISLHLTGEDLFLQYTGKLLILVLDSLFDKLSPAPPMQLIDFLATPSINHARMFRMHKSTRVR
jgi:hypothetical protein